MKKIKSFRLILALIISAMACVKASAQLDTSVVQARSPEFNAWMGQMDNIGGFFKTAYGLDVRNPDTASAVAALGAFTHLDASQFSNLAADRIDTAKEKISEGSQRAALRMDDPLSAPHVLKMMQIFARQGTGINDAIFGRQAMAKARRMAQLLSETKTVPDEDFADLIVEPHAAASGLKRAAQTTAEAQTSIPSPDSVLTAHTVPQHSVILRAITLGAALTAIAWAHSIPLAAGIGALLGFFSSPKHVKSEEQIYLMEGDTLGRMFQAIGGAVTLGAAAAALFNGLYFAAGIIGGIIPIMLISGGIDVDVSADGIYRFSGSYAQRFEKADRAFIHSSNHNEFGFPFQTSETHRYGAQGPGEADVKKIMSNIKKYSHEVPNQNRWKQIVLLVETAPDQAQKAAEAALIVLSGQNMENIAASAKGLSISMDANPDKRTFIPFSSIRGAKFFGYFPGGSD